MSWRRGITAVGIALTLIALGAASANAQSDGSSTNQATAPSAAQSTGGELVTGDNFQGMILEPSRHGEWRPERAQILALEQQLPNYILAHVDNRSRSFLQHGKLKTYRRFYGGNEENGRRQIQIYLFCNLKQWRLPISWPRGGGACYMQATWDLEKAEFARLTVNASR
jgi:hypothetical protein